MTWLVANWRIAVVAGLILLCAGMAKLASGYHERAITAEGKAKEQRQIITDMQVRQRDVAALDAKYTGELADAKATIDQLQSDVAAGRKRLQLNAKCPEQSTTGTASVDDATSPRLTDTAERDYFTLRERIETSGKMIDGLQQYIREQCQR
ncbi:lysis protein [Erwinia rhapontici]|uniref:lysis protein n=1 Tax=Erwinia rhapontici TaxID=55212 RepID=UPI004041E84E|nr:prophage endopeptidase [Erwinia rhapontici]